VRHSISEPRDLHAFATKVGATARNVEAARAAIGERVRAAESEVIRALRDRAAVEQAAAALVAATWEVDEVKAVKDRVEAFVADASMDDRRAKKARESVQALHEQGNRCAQEALSEQERVRGDSEAAQREATSREHVATRPVQPGARETPETKPPAASKHESSVANSGEILDQIRKLGELHEAGVLTAEEFSSKKGELLKRL
jgi:Short C-terminal domain